MNIWDKYEVDITWLSLLKLVTDSQIHICQCANQKTSWRLPAKFKIQMKLQVTSHFI